MTLTDTAIREAARQADELVTSGRERLRRTIVDAHAAGFTQVQIAELVSRSQPEVARHLRESRRAWQTVPELARFLRRLLADDDEEDALRFMLDGLNKIEQVASTADMKRFLMKPGSTGSERWDTLLACATAYVARRAGVVPPAWTTTPSLSQWWWPAGERRRRAWTMQRTPIEFRRAGIWFSERNFETA